MQRQIKLNPRSSENRKLAFHFNLSFVCVHACVIKKLSDRTTHVTASATTVLHRNANFPYVHERRTPSLLVKVQWWQSSTCWPSGELEYVWSIMSVRIMKFLWSWSRAEALRPAVYEMLTKPNLTISTENDTLNWPILYIVFHAYQSSAHHRLCSPIPISTQIRNPKFPNSQKWLTWLGLTACTILLGSNTSWIFSEERAKDRAIHEKWVLHKKNRSSPQRFFIDMLFFHLLFAVMAGISHSAIHNSWHAIFALLNPRNEPWDREWPNLRDRTNILSSRFHF